MRNQEIKSKIEDIEIMLYGLFAGGDITEAARTSIQFCINEAKKAINESNPNHKDTDLGYFAGLAMQGILSSPFRKEIGEEEEIAQLSIIVGKELIKQLDKEST